MILLALLFLAAAIVAVRGFREAVRGKSVLTGVVFGVPVLLGIIAYALEAIGLFGAFTHLAIVTAALAITLAALAWWIVLTRHLGRGREPGKPFSGWGVTGYILMVVIAILAFLTLTGALAPATSNEWDALAYHLAVPKAWLHDGSIHPVPYDHHSNFPMLTEMLFSIGLSLRSVATAKVFHWLFGMLGALSCYWAGREWVSRRAGLLAAALFLAAPIVAWEATAAYIDLASTVYAALSVFAFIKWMEPPSPLSSVDGGTRDRDDAWLYLAGVMAGFACGTKMTMVATSGLLVLWAAGCAILRRPGYVTWKHVGLLVGLALLIGGPWYLKTWIWTGNPVYPFAYSILDGRWWSAQAAAAYSAEQARFGIGKSAWALWVAPWTTVFHAQYYANPPATFTGTLQDARGANLFPAIFGSLGLGVVAFLPLWLLSPGLGEREKGRAGNGALALMVLYSGAFLLVWFALTHQTRYLVPLLPLLLVPGAAGVRAFWRAGAGWRWSVGAVAALSLLWGLLSVWALTAPAFPVVWGGQSADAWLSEREPIYRVSAAVNRQLPGNAKVLMLQEVRGFYLDRPYEWGNPEQNALIPWETLRSPEAMDAALRARGITHVMVNWGALGPERPVWARLAEAAADRGNWTPVIVAGRDPKSGLTVYRIDR